MSPASVLLCIMYLLLHCSSNFAHLIIFIRRQWSYYKKYEYSNVALLNTRNVKVLVSCTDYQSDVSRNPTGSLPKTFVIIKNNNCFYCKINVFCFFIHSVCAFLACKSVQCLCFFVVTFVYCCLLCYFFSVFAIVFMNKGDYIFIILDIFVVYALFYV